MAIRYDIVLDNNLIYNIQYVCFGVLNGLVTGQEPRGLNRETSGRLSGSNYRTLGRDFDVNKIQYIRYDYSWMNNPLDDQMLTAYEQEVKLIISQLPTMQDIVFFDYETKHAYVRVKDQPADKVMFILTLLRNLVGCVKQYWRSNGVHQGGYFLLRRMGIAPLKALVFYGFLQGNTTTDWSAPGNPEYLFLSDYPNFNSESNLFNFSTFGLGSYRRFIAQEDYNPWVQGSFAEQGHGYKRNSHYSSAYELFEGLNLSSPAVEFNEYHTEDRPRFYMRLEQIAGYRFGGTSPYRTLLDCHSIIGDEESLFPDIGFDPTVGFFLSAVPFESFPNTGERFDAFVEYISTL